MKILVTGGTTFVSRYTAEYFVKKGHEVFVLNRGNAMQSDGVKHIRADRHALGDRLTGMRFDVVIDITAYNEGDIKALLDSGVQFGEYIFVSSSAVYPETLKQPFCEDMKCGANSIWGSYGTDKLAAEEYLFGSLQNAYAVRPPYLYGPMNNLYREAFVFECAEKGRKFYIPKDGSMRLQFLYIGDLCRAFEEIIQICPKNRIFNLGGSETVTISEWVRLCYEVVGSLPETVSVGEDIEQRSYFPFYDYEYALDVSRQGELIDKTMPLGEGLRLSYEWYRTHRELVRKKPLIEFIDEKF